MDLRWYQRESCQAAWEFLCNKPGNPVVCLPTGAGKSLVIADIARHAVSQFAGRVIVLAHRKELLSQNAEKIRVFCPGLDVGIYSAGLGSRDTEHSVIVAGIQSVYERAAEFGARHLVLVDEVHLVPHDGEGMYRRFLDDLRSINPYLRMAGTTATPYRLDCGPLCRPDGLFQKVCYSAPIRSLISEGYLCRLTTTPADGTVDTTNVHLRGGEFVQHEAENLFCATVEAACREVVAKASTRRSVLLFSSGVRHAEQVVCCLEKLTGERVGLVTGETYPIVRQATLDDFRSGALRWCVNVDVLTTGFDAPNIDAIAILRATMSPGLFAQIVGRGFRIAENKTDCLVLDFGGNIRRHGPIDDPAYGVQDKRQSVAGEAPVKTCPNCEQESLLSSRECVECGFVFPQRRANHDEQADESKILAEPETFAVEEVTYHVHVKRKAEPGDVPTLRADYTCRRAAGNLGTEIISEWICLEHDGFAGKKAVAWWLSRSRLAIPSTVEEACDLARRGAVTAPRSIVAMKEGRWWRVTRAELDEPSEFVAELEDVPFDMEEAPF
jgi:DNA repair protein RadD